MRMSRSRRAILGNAGVWLAAASLPGAARAEDGAAATAGGVANTRVISARTRAFSLDPLVRITDPDCDAGPGKCNSRRMGDKPSPSCAETGAVPSTIARANNARTEDCGNEF